MNQQLEKYEETFLTDCCFVNPNSKRLTNSSVNKL